MDANKVMFKERSSEYQIILHFRNLALAFSADVLLKLPFKCFLGKATIFLFQFIRDVLALKLTLRLQVYSNFT